MPTGSCARIFAPMSSSPVTSGIEGASRMSSVSGLKVRPSTATVLPRKLPPAALETLRAIARLRLSLTPSTASTIRNCTSWSGAIFPSARLSFGKHEPPKPGPACRNFEPMRLSSPMPRATSCTSAPTFFRQIRDLVDEGDLGGEEGVGGVFDQLCGAPRGEHQGRLVERQRPVDVTEHFARTVIRGADDDSVRKFEIADRGTF